MVRDRGSGRDTHRYRDGDRPGNGVARGLADSRPGRRVQFLAVYICGSWAASLAS